MKKTKILCTYGPVMRDSKILRKMVKAGMNAVRINTAYGDVDEFDEIARHVWSVADIPIVADIKGPEIRIECENPMELGKNDIVRVGFDPSDEIFFNRDIYDQLSIGERIILDKGKCPVRVQDKSGGDIYLKLSQACRFRNGLGVNIPHMNLEIPTLSHADKKVIRWAKKEAVDFIALSFTRDVEDVRILRKALGKGATGIISKIENRQGIDNVDRIILESDGVMIARGDLGVEIPSAEIPLIQKDIIQRCNRQGKISLVATEMLHSMVENPQPTRAETSDVANAIIDGSDAIMLSAESAIGKYPVESVKVMSDIAHQVETHFPIRPLDEDVHDRIALAISKGVSAIIQTVDVDKIVCATRTGYTAMLISNFRVCKDIIAITDNDAVARKLHLVYAVNPFVHKNFSERGRVAKIARMCHSKGLVEKSDLVLFTAGHFTKKPTTNQIELHNVGDLLRYSV